MLCCSASMEPLPGISSSLPVVFHPSHRWRIKISVQCHNVLASMGHINPPTVPELFFSACQNDSLLIFSLKLYFPLFLVFPAFYNLIHHNGIFPCFSLISAQKTYVSPPSATASLCLIDSWLFLDPILFSDPWLLTPSIIKISNSGVWVI